MSQRIPRRICPTRHAPRVIALTGAFFIMSSPAISQVLRDEHALQLIGQSLSAMSPAGNIMTDLTLDGSVQFVLGSDNETIDGTFVAKGTLESRVSLPLASGVRLDVRQNYRGVWSAGERSGSMAYHNCLTVASWFVPSFLLSDSLATSTRQVAFIGAEQQEGATVYHLTIGGVPGNSDPLVTTLSQTDVYLNAVTLQPTSIAFNIHPDGNALANIPITVRFDDYQASGGFQIPHHIQRLMGSTLVLDISVNAVSVNAGLVDSDFDLPPVSQ